MIKKEIIQHTKEYYHCDFCMKRIIQDGKDIELIPRYDRGHKEKLSVDHKDYYIYHLHRTCLIEHLKKTIVPND